MSRRVDGLELPFGSIAQVGRPTHPSSRFQTAAEGALIDFDADDDNFAHQVTSAASSGG
jgi:hypothetical protein